MSLQTIINLLLLVLLVVGISLALKQGDALWAICFGAAFLQRFCNKPIKRRHRK